MVCGLFTSHCLRDPHRARFALAFLRYYMSPMIRWQKPPHIETRGIHERMAQSCFPQNSWARSPCHINSGIQGLFQFLGDQSCGGTRPDKNPIRRIYQRRRFSSLALRSLAADTRAGWDFHLPGLVSNPVWRQIQTYK